MQYILSIIFAALLVIAQSSWKMAVDGAHSPFKKGLTIPNLLHFAFSPMFLLGAGLYVVAMALYMYLLSRYQFSLIQSLAIPISLLFSILVAVVFFGDHLSIINYTGLLLLVVGIVLITQR